MTTLKIHEALPSIPARIKIESPFDRGGEGHLYLSQCGQYVVKLYHDASKNKEKLLLTIIDDICQYVSGEEREVITWPLAVGYSGDRLGVVTRWIPSPPYQDLLDFTYTPKQFVTQVCQGKTWADYLYLTRKLASVIGILHRKGCAHTDISYKNFLADLDRGSAVLIDVDGLVVEHYLPPQVSGTWGFMAPEIVMGQASPTEKTDRHSLAVLIFQTLLFRNPLKPLITYDEDQEKDQALSWGPKAQFSEYPDNWTNPNRPEWLGVPLLRGGELSYKILTPALQSLSKRAFVEGLFDPDKRPLVEEWEKALAVAVDQLWTCTKCQQPFIYPSWLRPRGRRSCPFCGQRVQPPYPKVVEIYQRTKDSWFRLNPEHRLILSHGSFITKDMVKSGRYPPPKEVHRQKIGHVEWDQRRHRFYLINDQGGKWQSGPQDEPRKYVAQRGESVPLIPGNRVYLGTDRLMLVME
jgi:DNA-binding helix-hairpin-helix protein with protein kinase domain